MVYDERSFSKSYIDKQLVTKPTENHVKLFRAYMRFRGHEFNTSRENTIV
jgi:hypothetical protein